LPQSQYFIRGGLIGHWRVLDVREDDRFINTRSGQLQNFIEVTRKWSDHSFFGERGPIGALSESDPTLESHQNTRGDE
jgi:hypothetical protein